MEKRLKIVATLILLLTLTATASASVTYLFLMDKPASINVALNTYRIELYKEETNPTTVINSITFPSLLVNSPNNASKTELMYIFTQQTPKTYTLKWSCFNLPNGFIIKAYWNLAGTLYYELKQNTDLNVALVAPSSGNTGMRIFFQIEATSSLSVPQDHQFSIQILAGE